tara:strand:- start:96 stop:266 length:171 start_codon:yes stop_codon:yes gene_type:complete
LEIFTFLEEIRNSSEVLIPIDKAREMTYISSTSLHQWLAEIDAIVDLHSRYHLSYF